MSFPDSEAEEQTLHTFFGEHIPGGETSKLRPACSFVQQFIAQELCGTIANDSTFDELWMHFQAILGGIFGKQDATKGPQSGPTSRICGSTTFENSWMFATTSFYSLSGLPDALKPTRAGGSSSSSNSNSRRRNRPGDPRLRGMEPMAVSLLSLLLARPPESSPPDTKNLFSVLLEPQRVWYPFTCTSPPMPPHTLAFLRHEGLPGLVLFENSRLYTHCLSNPPSLFPQGRMPHHAVRFQEVAGGDLVGGGEAGEVVRAAPDLSLSALELYLFSFAWYALSSYEDFYHGLEGPGRLTVPHRTHHSMEPAFRQERVALGWRRHGVIGLTHLNPYMTLLKDYLEAFFPHRGGASIGGRGGGSSGTGMSLQDELFLRVLVEFWLEGNTVLRPGVLKEQEEHHHFQQQQAWGNSNTLHLPAPRTTANYDPSVALLQSEYTPPTDMSVHGLLIVSAHLLADPKLKEACRRSLNLTVGTPAASASARTGEVSSEGERSALTPALEVLRPHVFGFLRVAFSADNTMHLSSAGFSLAVELWVLWMRPWAAASILRGHSPDSLNTSDCHSSASAQSGRASPSSTGSARGSSNQGGGLAPWISGVVAVVKDFVQIEPSRANSGGGRQTGTSRGGSGASAAGAREREVGGYSSDPWGAWVLENYSLYTTVLAAFVRKVGSMSFKVNDGPGHRGYHHHGGGANGQGNPQAQMAAMFADTRGANLRLLHRVVDVFSPAVASLLASAQNTLRQARDQRQGGSGAGAGSGNGEGLRAAECEILDRGRKAVSAIQGPNLVTLEKYQEVAEELLINIAHLANPRVSKHWFGRVERWFAGPGAEKITVRARAISSKLQELFGLPPNWKPKGHGENGQGGAQGAMKLSEMFHPEREKRAPYFLSQQGRTQLASGQRACKPWDVAYVGDPMYRPRRAWEVEALIALWVGLSELVNSRWLGWSTPDGEGGDSSRGSGSDSVFDDEGSGKAIIQGKDFQRRVWREARWAGLPCRVNLRPLADVRATVGLGVALYILWLAYRLSSVCGACVTAVLAALVVRLSTMITEYR
ncbi:unnamed protein product [Ectocarpus sp. 4 AP-2014]